MIYLFDVNLLIALLDRDHVHHPAAHRWVASFIKPLKWATCPLVENSFVRVTGSPAYPNSFGSASTALEELEKNCSSPEHAFWPDHISLCDRTLWTGGHIVGSSHVTDLYLLALAAKQGGKLATFDQRIPVHFIRGGKEALCLVPT